MSSNSEPDSSSDLIRNAAALALADVNALGVDGEDRTILLTALLEARLRAASPDMGAVPGAKTPLPAEVLAPVPTLVPVAEGDLIGKMAAGLKVDRDTLELVYADQDGEPLVVISSKKIDSGKSAGARQLAQLVAAARQASGVEEWTSVNTIRAVVSDYGRLDTANFASSIQQLDKVAVLRGKGLGREVKITKPGMEATADLIKSLAGTES